jgi:hypothetical protein
VECFETLLKVMHQASKQDRKGRAGREGQAGCPNKEYCITHNCFQIDYEVSRVCRCGLRETVLTSDPNESFMMTLYPNDVFQKVQHMMADKKGKDLGEMYYSQVDRFFQLVKASQVSHYPTCKDGLCAWQD